MIKPDKLQKGDCVAIVSLSRGMLGEAHFIHLLDIARDRLENGYGLRVKVMPNALRGIRYLYEHPEARAQDLMDAFRDPSVKAIINAIGGDDTIRLLPYIDFSVIKNNPKIFMGFSDTTVNHFMMYRAGLVSYYGGSLMNQWAEYTAINDYTKQALESAFFSPQDRLTLEPSGYCSYSDKKIWFHENNIRVTRETEADDAGYEVLQGTGTATGRLLGGCAETFVYLMGTPLWPDPEEWRDKILFLEVSDEDETSELPEYYFAWILRNLKAQGIFDVIKGILMGKPPVKGKYEAYKEILLEIVNEDRGYSFPIFYNVNFGHGYPTGIIPYGLECCLDCDREEITILEKFTNG